jgi:hypothetical protein
MTKSSNNANSVTKESTLKNLYQIIVCYYQNSGLILALLKMVATIVKNGISENG